MFLYTFKTFLTANPTSIPPSIMQYSVNTLPSSLINIAYSIVMNHASMGLEHMMIMFILVFFL